MIHRAFAPSSEGMSWGPICFHPSPLCASTLIVDIAKAQRIKETFEESEKQGKGAYGLEGVMIDAPVYKQVGGWVCSTRT